MSDDDGDHVSVADEGDDGGGDGGSGVGSDDDDVVVTKKAAAAKGKPAASKAAPKASAGAGKAALGKSAAAPAKAGAGGAKPAAAGTGGSGAAAAVALGKKITTEREAEAVLLDYLNRTNRPYSALNVHDNLHGVVGKTVIPKLLDKLADSGAICAKTYGKFRLYWASQEQYGEVAQADMEAMTRAVAERTEELGAAKARRKELEGQVAALGSAMTAEQVAAALASYRAAVAEGRARLTKLTGAGVVLVTPEQRAAAVATLDRFRRVWRERRAMVCAVVDSMAEGLEKKPRQLYEAIGIETDEEARVNIADFATS